MHNGRKMRAHHLFMHFHLAARRFVGLCVTTTKQKLCHVAAPMLREAHHARQLASGENTPLFEILDCGSYSQDSHRDLDTPFCSSARCREIPGRTRAPLDILLKLHYPVDILNEDWKQQLRSVFSLPFSSIVLR